MKLIFAIKSLNVTGGGAERVLVDVANGLVERGHEVIVLTFDAWDESFYPLDRRVARLDLGLGEVGQPTPRFQLFLALGRIRRAVHASKPDVVVGFMHSMYLPLGISLSGLGIPVIASEHTAGAHFVQRPVQKAMIRLLGALFVAKTVPSEAVRNEPQIARQRGIVVLPNPINLRAFENIAHRRPLLPPTILSLGRLREEKNHVGLIAAFGLLVPFFPEWRLRIVGDGELRHALLSEIRNRKLAQRVELVGATRDVVAEYERATIVAVPSHYEAFGLVTAEALAAGRPVVGVADCAGTRELIRHGENGLLVDGGPDHVRNLAEGLRTLMENQSLRDRLAAAGPASVQRFALGNVLDTWERCIMSFAPSITWASPS